MLFIAYPVTTDRTHILNCDVIAHLLPVYLLPLPKVLGEKKKKKRVMGNWSINFFLWKEDRE
jgi:hypothetical protein